MVGLLSMEFALVLWDAPHSQEYKAVQLVYISIQQQNHANAQTASKIQKPAQLPREIQIDVHQLHKLKLVNWLKVLLG